MTDPARFLARVEEVAVAGYALDRGEYLTGVVAAASTFNWLGVTHFIWNVGLETSYDVDLSITGGACRDASPCIAAELAGTSPRLRDTA